MGTGGGLRLDRTNTAIVVDSTADLPPEMVGDRNVSMVPLKIFFGEDVLTDWVDIEPEQFYARLRLADRLPTTSQPAAGVFIEHYQRLRERFQSIYSLHLSSKMSGTYLSASLAAEEVDGVVVVDSQLATVSLSLLVDRLLALLDRGTDHEEIMAYIARFQRERGFVFMVDTLEYLRKGGRIGRAANLAGTLLNVKPILTIVEGEVAPYRKVRGERKARDEMLAYFLEHTDPEAVVHVAAAHADALPKVKELVDLVRSTDRKVNLRFIGWVGPVIGTYAGPGTVGLFFIQE